MAAITPTTIIRDSVGSLTMLTAVFSTVADGDTWASGLGTTVMTWVAQGTGNPATQASAGIAATFSSGTFTFYPGEDSLSMRLMVFADV